MRRIGWHRSHRRVNPAGIILAVLGIMMMPVDYRAGASMTHPHAMLQLVGDLARGSLAHHDDQFHGGYGVPRSEPAPPAVLTTDQTRPGIHPSDRTLLASALSRSQRLETRQPDDTPTLSPRLGIGLYLTLAVLLPAAYIATVRWQPYRAVWAVNADWHGIVPRPEPPPPRQRA